MNLKKLFHFGTNTVRVINGNDCRQKLLQGALLVNQASKQTLGPKGRNVAIDYEAGSPRITKDGVTVAKNVMIYDRHTEMGAALIRQSAGLTNDQAGDGTTTSILIATTLFQKSQRLVEAGYNPIFIVRGIKLGLQNVLEILEELKYKVSSDEDLLNVCRVSCNYEERLAQIIYRALKHIPIDGLLNIEPGGRETHLEIASGVRLTRGLLNDHFKDPGKNQCDLISPLILVSTNELKSIKEIVPYLDYAASKQQSLFIMAPDISNDVISTLIFNKTKGIVHNCAITVPGFGDFSENLLKDFQVFVGCEPTWEDSNQRWIVPTQNLGGAVKITVDTNETIMYGVKGNKDKIDEQKMELKNSLNQAQSERSRQLIKERIARFSESSGVIYVGGNSEVEMNENRDRLVDSLNAAKTALKEGILPGGGAALAHASRVLEFTVTQNEEQKQGVKLLQETLLEPIKTLLTNAGEDECSIIEQLLHQDNYNLGFDLRKKELGDMIKLGVVDSYQVVTNSLINGVNLGCMLLTCETAIVQDKHYIATSIKNYRKEIF